MPPYLKQPNCIFELLYFVIFFELFSDFGFYFSSIGFNPSNLAGH